MGSFHQRSLLGAGVGGGVLAPSGTHVWCLGTSACMEPCGTELDGDKPVLLAGDVMLVTGSHQDFCEGCYQCPLCRQQQGRDG